MAEYITKEALRAYPIRENHCDKEHANEHFIRGIESVMEYAEGLPAADVALVVHGHWVQTDEDIYECNQCHRDWVFSEATPSEMNLRYCPSCGAKMDGGVADG